MTARLCSVKTHVVLFNIDPKVNKGVSYTRPDKCETEGVNTGQCSFMKKEIMSESCDGLFEEILNVVAKD